MPDYRDDIDVSTLLQAQRELLLGAPPAGAVQALPAGGGEFRQDDTFVSVKHYAYLVYGRKWCVLLFTVLVVAAAWAYARMRPKIYEARHSVVVSEGLAVSGDLFAGRPTYYGPETVARMAETKPVAHLANRIYAEGLKAARDDIVAKLKP
ncbi:MAG: hypothetical protein ACYTGB_05755, partial [Planctomycetota bacterium]